MSAEYQNIGNAGSGAGSSLLPVTTMRNLSDKIHEKRKGAATEVETVMRSLVQREEKEEARKLIELLSSQFVASTNAQARKGGLWALASCSIALGPANMDAYLQDLIVPMLRCMNDVDAKVRFTACESMYNLVKVARDKILQFFNDIFDALCKAFADPDTAVKNAAQLLDRLTKDIVVDVPNFDVKGFVPVLKDKIHAVNQNVRVFLLGWIKVLDSSPEINMLEYLPDFLDGIFVMLSDPSKELRRQADETLSEFLRNVKKEGKVEFRKIMKILISHCTSKDTFTRVTAIQWCNDFISIGAESILQDASDILSAVLSSLSFNEPEISNASQLANESLLKLLEETKERYEFEPIVDVLLEQLTDKWVPTRLTVLNWILMLHSKSPENIDRLIDRLFPALIATLGDESDEVLRSDLKVLSRLASIDRYFTQFITKLLDFFKKERKWLHTRGSTVIRHICLSLDKEKIYRTISANLVNETDLDFASTMVQSLNMILLISPELLELRVMLKDLNTPKGKSFFDALYRSWCHNPAALFSLCLLTQAYEHASSLIAKFSDLEITTEFLMEIDKLVQLIESPIFTNLRLQLLEPEKYPYLYKSLYGLLMILPQSSAFAALRNRLTSVATLGLLHLLPESNLKGAKPVKQVDGIDWARLSSLFDDTQKRHMIYRLQMRESQANR